MSTRKIILAIAAFCSWTNTARAQTGGTYDLSHNVVASGGGSNSTGGTYRVDGTVGQNIAGTVSTGGALNVRGGFWNPLTFAPTAASVSISGRITTAEGSGISHVQVILANPVSGELSKAVSSTFGYYRFDNVEVGQIYILTVASNRYVFEPSTRVINLVDELMDENFIALPE